MTRLTWALVVGVAWFACPTHASQSTAEGNSSIVTVDHYVRVKSTVPAMAGQIAQLYVRERTNPATLLRSASLENRVVLFVHGAGTPAEVAVDVPYADYSWMAYLADAGFDVFSMDVTGYGRSTRPAAMDDPCNLSREQQEALVPMLLPAPCTPSYSKQLTTIATDWNDIAAVVEYVRALRHVDRLALVAWSRGAPRAGGYAAQHPERVSRLVLLAPAYDRGAAATAPFSAPADGPATTTQSRQEFIAGWDRQVGCPDQYDRAAADTVWAEMLESDPVGATWGLGVRRAPAFSGTWTQAVAGKLGLPTLMVAGAHDRQVPPDRVRDLYADVASRDKIFIDLACSSHNAMWENNHLLLFDASRQWLTEGSVNGTKQGMIRLGYPSSAPAPTN
jgi:pimeloyl-ACP methyl ester carboxylesterase